ncbi:hypothetical protein A9Q99_07965 [Gammaproteobacteria bacterium 45_16_T64]|nr:hypothetical protein A9Q99_07965 [Gammaproteobacteria bacterium 45_16_T64]
MEDNNIDDSILYIWKNRTLYIGKYPDITPVTQGASSLIVSIDGTASVTSHKSQKTTNGRSFLIPAGEPYTIDSRNNRIAHYLLDSYNEDFFRIEQSMKNRIGNIYTENKREFVQAAVFEKLITHRSNTIYSESLLNSTVFPSIFESPKRPSTDQRIIKIIDLIQKDPTINYTNKHMANLINVSEETLMRLFKATTGVTIRRFRIWRRMFVSAKLLTLGKSTTEAAIGSGFFDAPHFNHAFRDMLGMNPSSIIQRTKNMEIFVHK